MKFLKYCSLFLVAIMALPVLAEAQTKILAEDEFRAGDSFDETARRRKEKVYFKDGIIYERTDDKGYSICAFPAIRLHKTPGVNGTQISTVVFTEELRHLGEEAYVKGENHNYIKVKTPKGKSGWVIGNFVVRDGGVVVITDRARIYENPNSKASITGEAFHAGEIVILSDFRDGWVLLTNKSKAKSGWVEGYEKLSLQEGDIEAAALFADIMRERDVEQKRLRLLNITKSLSSPISREMKRVINDAYNRTFPEFADNNITRGEEEFPFFEDGEDNFADDSFAFQDNNNNTSGFVDEPIPDNNTSFEGSFDNSTSINNANYYLEKVVDSQTGQYYNRVVESGTVQPVKSNKTKDIFYAYHKNLPVGTKILLAVPGTQSFVQLEVVARLRNDNPNVVGLCGELIEKVYGVPTAKEVKRATIIYPQI